MDPITLILGLGLINTILEKSVLPARRLMKQQVAQYDLGPLGKLGLKPEELEELRQHPVVQRGIETERQAVVNAARAGEQHV
jgi:hypothetical protein